MLTVSHLHGCESLHSQLVVLSTTASVQRGIYPLLYKYHDDELNTVVAEIVSILNMPLPRVTTMSKQ